MLGGRDGPGSFNGVAAEPNSTSSNPFRRTYAQSAQFAIVSRLEVGFVQLQRDYAG
jgi:hypothetical protein